MRCMDLSSIPDTDIGLPTMIHCDEGSISVGMKDNASGKVRTTKLRYSDAQVDDGTGDD